jgi:lipoprotein-anchoring transpeptidase ErfK/SrfK
MAGSFLSIFFNAVLRRGGHVMRKSLCIWAGLIALGLSQPAAAQVRVHIDLSTQTMNVAVAGQPFATWPISSGKSGYATPTGTFRPGYMTPMHRSRKYNNAPMPYAIFFNGGVAVHGTTAVGALGRPASHGCIRLRTSNAKILYTLIQEHGASNTRIEVARSRPRPV